MVLANLVSVKMNCKRCNKNKRIKGRTICYKCRYEIQKEKDPIKLSYYRLKYHAKERSKDFTLTLEQFTEFCYKTDYISKKGRGKDCYHVDRKDETQGYHHWNIQALTNSENVKKYVNFVM